MLTAWRPVAEHPAELGVCWQANLDRDVIVSPANEYEVLQLLLSDCRDRLTDFNSAPWL